MENKLWGLQIAYPCNLTRGFTHSKALFWKGEEALKDCKQKETQTEEQGSSICLEVPYLGLSPPAWPSWLCSRASTSCGSEHALLCCVTVTERSTHFKTDLCSSPLLCSGSTEYRARVLWYQSLEYPICFVLPVQKTPKSCGTRVENTSLEHTRSLPSLENHYHHRRH